MACIYEVSQLRQLLYYFWDANVKHVTAVNTKTQRLISLSLSMQGKLR